MTKPTFLYSGYYRTLDAAERGLEHCFATGEIVPAERPIIRVYSTPSGKRYGIALPV